MKIIVTGSTGLLGRYFLKQAKSCCYEVFGAGGRGGVLSSKQSFLNYANDIEPDWIIHCAAMTNVDECERNPQLAEDVNVTLTKMVCEVAVEAKARVLYISTDSVFDNHKMYGSSEADIVSPLNVYAKSKLGGETVVMTHNFWNLVFRTNFFGVGGKSYSDWIVNSIKTEGIVRAFNDVWWTPIYAGTLAEYGVQAMDRGMTGLYHVAGYDGIPQYEFAKALVGALGYNENCVFPISVDDVPLLAKRPKDTMLDTSKFEHDFDTLLPYVSQSIDAYAEEYKHVH